MRKAIVFVIILVTILQVVAATNHGDQVEQPDITNPNTLNPNNVDRIDWNTAFTAENSRVLEKVGSDPAFAAAVFENENARNKFFEYAKDNPTKVNAEAWKNVASSPQFNFRDLSAEAWRSPGLQETLRKGDLATNPALEKYRKTFGPGTTFSGNFGDNIILDSNGNIKRNVPKKDDQGNPVIDAEGNPVMEEESLFNIADLPQGTKIIGKGNEISLDFPDGTAEQPVDASNLDLAGKNFKIEGTPKYVKFKDGSILVDGQNVEVINGRVHVENGFARVIRTDGSIDHLRGTGTLKTDGVELGANSRYENILDGRRRASVISKDQPLNVKFINYDQNPSAWDPNNLQSNTVIVDLEKGYAAIKGRGAVTTQRTFIKTDLSQAPDSYGFYGENKFGAKGKVYLETKDKDSIPLWKWNGEEGTTISVREEAERNYIDVSGNGVGDDGKLGQLGVPVYARIGADENVAYGVGRQVHDFYRDRDGLRDEITNPAGTNYRYLKDYEIKDESGKIFAQAQKEEDGILIIRDPSRSDKELVVGFGFESVTDIPDFGSQDFIPANEAAWIVRGTGRLNQYLTDKSNPYVSKNFEIEESTGMVNFKGELSPDMPDDVRQRYIEMWRNYGSSYAEYRVSVATAELLEAQRLGLSQSEINRIAQRQAYWRRMADHYTTISDENVEMNLRSKTFPQFSVEARAPSEEFLRLASDVDLPEGGERPWGYERPYIPIEPMTPEQMRAEAIEFAKSLPGYVLPYYATVRNAIETGDWSQVPKDVAKETAFIAVTGGVFHGVGKLAKVGLAGLAETPWAENVARNFPPLARLLGYGDEVARGVPFGRPALQPAGRGGYGNGPVGRRGPPGIGRAPSGSAGRITRAPVPPGTESAPSVERYFYTIPAGEHAGRRGLKAVVDTSDGRIAFTGSSHADALNALHGTPQIGALRMKSINIEGIEFQEVAPGVLRVQFSSANIYEPVRRKWIEARGITPTQEEALREEARRIVEGAPELRGYQIVWE